MVWERNQDESWQKDQGPSTHSTLNWGPKVFALEWIKWPECEEEKFLDSLTWEPHKLSYQDPLVKPWPLATIRLREHKGSTTERADGIMNIGLFNQTMQIICVFFTWMFYENGYSVWPGNTYPTKYYKTKTTNKVRTEAHTHGTLWRITENDSKLCGRNYASPKKMDQYL